MLRDDLVVKLRKLQAKMIEGSKESVSFSEVVNQVLEEGLKQYLK